MIAIIDYGMGNVRSVYNTIEYIGEEAIITSDPSEINDASHIILPGVGAFGDAMTNLAKRDLIDVLRQQVFEKGKPFLGICLGLQLLAKFGHEHGFHNGLGWLDAEVIKFKLEGTSLKIPHMGWNDIKLMVDHPLFSGLNEDQTAFYFVHSYHIVCSNEKNVVAVCNYGYDFAAAVYEDNFIATQFHPEKSQENGIQVMENFVNWRP